MSDQVKDIVERLKDLVHEGNIRRILVKKEDEVIVNVPLTAGIVGGVLALNAPLLLVATAVATFGFGCKVELENTEGEIIDADITDL